MAKQGTICPELASIMFVFYELINYIKALTVPRFMHFNESINYSKPLTVIKFVHFSQDLK